jgi:import inner membrane translocase subunit TIM50
MKYINDNKEELERLLAQDQQMMNAQVPGTLLEAMDQILGKAPPPAVPGAQTGTTGTTAVAASSSQASPPSSVKT